MTKLNYFLSLLSASILGGAIILGIQFFFLNPQKNYDSISEKQQIDVVPTKNKEQKVELKTEQHFLNAATICRPAVVHIRVIYDKQYVNDSYINEMFREFHDENLGHAEARPRQSAGSGVIITSDGYIATNHHVIDRASQIEVILNDKRSYHAELIGSDPATDLALLKIEEKNLPFARYGNSDKLIIGEWVLAIGNPFDLTSTVTAGIVSAKGRNLNLLRDIENGSNYAIESFIQTDAAVNPGNSGGALVNLEGELIGINTAIASQTGYYAGYSFAVPVNIVQKIMDDLLQYGEPQRALLGVQIQDIDAQLVKDENLDNNQGVFVAGVSSNGAAKRAGIQSKDIILSIDNKAVNSSSELQSIIALHRPGDKVKVRFIHEGEEKTTSVSLRNKEGDLDIIRENNKKNKVLGAILTEISADDKKKHGIKQGVKVMDIGVGKLAESGIRNGFIITFFDEKAIKTPEDINKLIENKDRVIAIEGIYPNGNRAYYAIGW